MAELLSVATMPKTSTFQARINPDVKSYVEDIYARSGMTLTDAFNAFLQQSINVDGLPFLMTPNSKELLRQQAVSYLINKADAAFAEAEEKGWISEEEVLAHFGIEDLGDNG